MTTTGTLDAQMLVLVLVNIEPNHAVPMSIETPPQFDLGYIKAVLVNKFLSFHRGNIPGPGSINGVTGLTQ